MFCVDISRIISLKHMIKHFFLIGYYFVFKFCVAIMINHVKLGSIDNITINHIFLLGNFSLQASASNARGWQ